MSPDLFRLAVRRSQFVCSALWCCLWGEEQLHVLLAHSPTWALRVQGVLWVSGEGCQPGKCNHSCLDVRECDDGELGGGGWFPRGDTQHLLP